MVDLTSHQLTILLSSVLAGGAGSALVIQVIKKTGIKFGVFEKDADAVFHWLSLAVVAVITGAGAIVQYHSKLPDKVIGISGLSILGVATTVFKNATYIKGFLSKVKTNLDSDAKALETKADTKDIPTFGV